MAQIARNLRDVINGIESINGIELLDRRGTAGKACRERVPFSRLRRVNAQLVKTGNVSLLSAAPFDSGKAERKT